MLTAGIVAQLMTLYLIEPEEPAGVGGSKLLDGLDNLMLVCAFWNGEMESTSADAASARGWGHKIPAWQTSDMPVFDLVKHRWYTLLENGTKVEFIIGECF